MKAQVYEITVSGSFMGAIHGEYYRVREIFVPEIGVVINERNIWKDPERYIAKKCDRYLGQAPNPVLVTEIEVPDNLAEELLIIINT